MSNSKLIELSYYDPAAMVRLSAYADTVVLDHNEKGSVICAIRFGGYPEMIRAMADAIYGGATIEATQNDTVRQLQSTLKGYRRQLSHDGVYAVATLMANDDSQKDDPGQEDGEEGTLKKRSSRENATFSARKGTVRVYLRSWITKRRRHSFPRFRTMYSLLFKAEEISDSWRSSRKKSGSTHGRWNWRRMIRMS